MSLLKSWQSECRFRAVNTPRPVAQGIRAAQQIGEIPDDGQPHLGSLQGRLVPSPAFHRSAESHSRARMPPLQCLSELVLRPCSSFVSAMAALLGRKPQREHDIKDIAGVCTSWGEIAGIRSMVEHRVDESLNMRNRDSKLDNSPSGQPVVSVDRLQSSVISGTPPHSGRWVDPG